MCPALNATAFCAVTCGRCEAADVVGCDDVPPPDAVRRVGVGFVVQWFVVGWFID